jgi:hypothetical protein
MYKFLRLKSILYLCIQGYKNLGIRTVVSVIRKIESFSKINCDTALGVANEIPSIVDPADCSVATAPLFSRCSSNYA